MARRQRRRGARVMVSGPEGFFDDPGLDVEGRAGGSLGVFMTWAGAIMSLSLVVGMAVWVYQLTMRDLGGIPVVHAVDGPMREAPDDPGGRLALHQGLAVNTVAAEGATADPADRLILAPSPVELSAEDQPPGLLRLAAALANAAPPAAEPADEDGGSAVTTAPGDDATAVELASLDFGDARPLAPGEPPAEGRSAPVPGDDGNTVAAPAAPPAPAVAAPKVLDASVPGVRVSPRPMPRPLTDLAAQAVAAEVALAVADPETAGEVDPESIAPGTGLVQLGAFPSRDVARGEWRRLATRFEDYFDAKLRVIEAAESGGRKFFRLRATGFADIGDARRFCAVLQAEGANCIPVVTR